LPLIGQHVHRPDRRALAAHDHRRSHDRPLRCVPADDVRGRGVTDAHTRDRWAAELTARARAYWTPARTAELARGKALLLPPAEAAPLLRALGLLHHDASMPSSQVAKYFQVNHMVALLGPGLRALRAQHPTIRLLDAGCGRSYLTLLVAWCAKHVWSHPLEVLGVDRNPAVIEEGRRRCALAQLDDVVRFEAGALDALDVRAGFARAFGDAEDRAVHGVIALHACDTATCDALVLGIALDAELIAVAPCCQAELARAWSALDDRGAGGAFAPIWGSPHLRRETAAHVTDAMRTLLLRAAGYEVLAMEFVPAEHTRKNTLIRAIKRGAGDPDARAAYDALCAATGGAGLALAARLAALG
jgi:SAM-dependent methyltransferase